MSHRHKDAQGVLTSYSTDPTAAKKADLDAAIRRIQALEDAQPTPVPTPIPDPTPVPVPTPTPTPSGYVGFGAKVTGGAGKQIVHPNHNDSGPGSFREFLGSDRTIVFDFDGTINLQSTISASGLRNLTIDATGHSLTFTGYGLDFSGWDNFIVRNLAGRALKPIQFASNFTFRQSGNGYIEHISADGYSHRALDIWDNCHDITVAWSIFGPKGPQGASNFPFLAGKQANRISVDHCLFYGGETRMPQFDFDNADGTGAAPTDTTGDMANCLCWTQDPAYFSLLTVHGQARVNARQSYFYANRAGYTGPNHAIHTETGGRVYSEGNYGRAVDLTTSAANASPYPVPAYAVLPLEASALAAAQAVLAGAGRWPRDAVDAGYVAKVTL